jgi:hypothetical protein
MKIELTGAELSLLRGALAENGGPPEGDCVLDAYEPEPAFTMEFEFVQGGIDVLAAAYMAYDEPMDGWYLTERIEDAGLIARLVRSHIGA